MFAAATKLKRVRTNRELRATDDDDDARVGVDDELGVLETNADFAAGESYPQFERRPRRGKDRIHIEHPGSGPEPGEPEGESLPEAAHGGEVKTGGR
jgi:hypothetical protein